MATTEDVKKWEEQYGKATAGGVNIVDDNGKIIDNVPYSKNIGNALSGDGTVYQGQDGSWQAKAPSYMSLDEKTGKITIVAPESTIKNADWLKENFTNNDDFKALSASLKLDPQGKTSVTYTDKDGNEQQTTLKDMFDKYQKAFNDYAKDYETVEKLRDEVKNTTASGINMTDNDVLVYAHSTSRGKNKFSSDVPVYLPDYAFSYYDFAKLGSYNPENKTISAKDFYEWYNLDDGTEGKDELISRLMDAAHNSVVFWQKWGGKSDADTKDFDSKAAGDQYARAMSFYKTLTNDNPEANAFTNTRMFLASTLNSLTDNLFTTTGNALQATRDFVGWLDQVDDMIVPLRIVDAPIKGVVTAGRLASDMFYTAGKTIAGIETPQDREVLGEVGIIGMIANALLDSDYDAVLDVIETNAGIANDKKTIEDNRDTVHNLLLDAHNDMTRLSSSATAGSVAGGFLAEALKQALVTNVVGGVASAPLSAASAGIIVGADTASKIAAIAATTCTAEDVISGAKVIAASMNAKQLAGAVKAGAVAVNIFTQGLSDTILNDSEAIHKMFVEGDASDAIEAVTLNTTFNGLGELTGLGVSSGWQAFKKTAAGQAVEAFGQRMVNRAAAVKYGALARLADTMQKITDSNSGAEKYKGGYEYELATASRNIANAAKLAEEGETVTQATRRLVSDKVELEVAYGRISRQAARTVLELQTDPRVGKYYADARDAAGKIVKLENGAGIREGAKVLFTQDTANYIARSNRIEYLIAKGGEDLKDLTKAEKKYLGALQKKVAQFEDGASQELLDAISEYVEKAKLYQFKFNNLLADEGLLDRQTLRERRQTGYWGQRGENYMFSQTLKKDTNVENAKWVIDEFSSGNNYKMKAEMDDYSYKPGDENADYMDPQLAMYSQQVAAAKVMDGRRWGDALLKVNTTAKQIDTNGRPVTEPELKKLRKEAQKAASDTFKKFKTTDDYKDYGFGKFYALRENLSNKIEQSQEKIEKILSVSPRQKNAIALDLDQDGVAFLSRRFDIPEYGRVRTRAELDALYESASVEQKAAIERAVGIDNKYLSSLRKRRATYERKLAAAQQGKAELSDISPSEFNIGQYTATTKRARAAAKEPSPSSASQYASPESARLFPGESIEEARGRFAAWAAGNDAAAAERASVSSSGIVDLSPADTTGRVGKDLSKRISSYQSKIRELNKQEADIIQRLNVRTYNEAIRDTDLSQQLTNSFIANSPNIMNSKTFDKYAREVRLNTLTARQQTTLKNSYDELKALQAEAGLVESGEDEFTQIITEFTNDFVGTVADDLEENVLFKETLQQYVDAGVNEEEAVRYLALENTKNAIGGKDFNGFIERGLNSLETAGNLTTKQKIRFRRAIKKAIESNVKSELSQSVEIMTKSGAGDMVNSEEVFDEIYSLMDDFIKDNVKAPNVIRVMTEDGDFKLYEVSPVTAYLYNNRPNFSNTKSGILAKFFQQTNRIFKLATTGYGLSSFTNQWLRDPLNSYAMAGMVRTLKGNTEEMGRLLGDNAVAAIQRELGKEGWDNLVEAGVKNATEGEIIANEVARQADIMYGDTSPETKYYREMATGRRETLFGDYEKPVGKMEKALEWLEQHSLGNSRELYLRKNNYMQAYNDALSLGKTSKEAKVWAELVADNATTDFSRTFAWGSQLINSVPFLGAALNGTASFWRLLEVDPVGVAGRFMSGLAIPQMALAAQSLQGEENRRAYMSVPEYIKQENLVFAADGQVFKIPIPQELSAFLQPFRYVIEKAMNGTDEAWSELVLNNLLSISPIDLTGFADLDDPLDKDADFFSRLSNEGETLVSQLAPVAVKTTYMAVTGRDPYTHSPIDTSKTYLDDEGNLQIMDSTDSNFSQWVSDTLKGFGIELSASSAEALLSNFFGQASIDTADSIMRLFSGDMVGAASIPFNRVAKPFTPTSYDEKDIAWKEAVKELQAEKTYLMRADGELAKINNSIGATSDPEKLKNLRAQYREIVQGYQDKVFATVQKFNSLYGADYGWKKYSSTLQLLSFYNNTQDLITDDAKADAQELYFDAQNSAKQTMSEMGFNGTNDLSVFGYLKTNQNGDAEVKATLPTSILNMQNVFYQSRDEATAKITNTIKNVRDVKGQTLEEKYKEMTKKEDQYYSAKKYDALKKLYKDWDIEFMTGIYPILAENDLQDNYGNSLLDNKDFVYEIGKYIRVPEDFMGKGKYISAKTGINKQDAYKKAYVQYLFKQISGKEDKK